MPRPCAGFVLRGICSPMFLSTCMSVVGGRLFCLEMYFCPLLLPLLVPHSHLIFPFTMRPAALCSPLRPAAFSGTVVQGLRQ